MKNVLLLLLLLYFFNGCKKLELPPATQTGSNTIGMLVNGTLFLNDCALCPIAGFPTKGIMEVSARNSKNDRLYFWVNTNYTTGTNRINKMWYVGPYVGSDSCYIYTHYSENNNCYSYKLIDSTTSGITITRLDTIRKIISATFYMTLNNYQGGQLNITEGRFDASY